LRTKPWVTPANGQMDAMHVEVKGAIAPAIGFGTHRIRGDGLVGLLRYALDVGSRHIDAAASYGKEAKVGARSASRGSLAKEPSWQASDVVPLGGTLDAFFRRAPGCWQRDLLLRPNTTSRLGQPSIVHHPLLSAIGTPYGKSAAQVVLRWLIEQEKVVAISVEESGSIPHFEDRANLPG
jgi:diketogulonate reductase-like aldo/keto reductase